jgi:DNA ligase (NAD+)
MIERAGEVIPKVIKVITSQRRGIEKKIYPPKQCPICQGEIARAKDEEVYIYCINPNCPAQLKGTLLHFASRPAMDIEGMGESLVEELVNRGLVKSIADIYKLTSGDLLNLPLFKEKKAANILSAIEESKTRGLGRLIFGLGIRHIGEKIAGLLADEFSDLEKFFHLTIIDLEKVDEIGPVVSASLVAFFSSRKVREIVDELRAAGVVMRAEKKAIRLTKITGKTFIFTGELRGLSRGQAQKKVEQSGAKTVSAISKNIDFVVVGDNPGSKYDKAKKLGLKIINEQEFLVLLSQ